MEVLVGLRNVVHQDENDHILNLVMKLAHDDDANNKITALKILNELAPEMG